MNLIAIGDIHGKTKWNKIVEKEKDTDKIVFIGDYFDSFDIHPYAQLNNFLDILKFKRENMDKVTLLIGNHDFHYFNHVNNRCSGHNPNYAKEFGEILQIALDDDLIQMSYQHENLLFTHAGVSSTWANNNKIDYKRGVNISEQINTLFKENPEAFYFTEGRNFSGYGDDICQTPIWIRPKSLNKKPLSNYIQIVGHTGQPNIIFNDDFILIDVLDKTNNYLHYDGEKFTEKES